MSDSKKRLDFLDLTKGLGMILVLIGHLQGDSIFTFSPYIEDPLLKVRVNRQREVKAIGSFGNPTAGTNYCLITAGTNGGV